MENFNYDAQQDVKLVEYELLKYVMYIDSEDVLSNEWNRAINDILVDYNHQKLAIKLVKDITGITTLNGAVTPSIIISNSKDVEPEILDELLENILFGYVDNKKTKSIMHVKDFCGVSYLNLILSHSELTLKERFQEKITDEIIKKYEENLEYKTISMFFMNKSIDIKYKEKLIDLMSEEDLYELKVKWDSNMLEVFYAILKNNIDVCISEEELEKEEKKLNSCFDEVLRLITNKIGEVYE